VLLGLSDFKGSPAISSISSFLTSLLLVAWGWFLVWGVPLADADWAELLRGFEDAELAFGPIPPSDIRGRRHHSPPSNRFPGPVRYQSVI